jgi:hypothetical protein
MSDDAKGFSWNPFMRLDEPGQAEAAARNGVWVAGLLGLSYALGILFALTGFYPLGSADDGPPPDGYDLSVDGFIILIAAILGYCVHRWQPRWTAVVLLLWITAETLLKILSMLIGAGLQGGLLLNVVAMIGAILSVRGAFALADQRKGRNRNPAEVF